MIDNKGYKIVIDFDESLDIDNYDEEYIISLIMEVVSAVSFHMESIYESNDKDIIEMSWDAIKLIEKNYPFINIAKTMVINTKPPFDSIRDKLIKYNLITKAE